MTREQQRTTKAHKKKQRAKGRGKAKKQSEKIMKGPDHKPETVKKMKLRAAREKETLNGRGACS